MNALNGDTPSETPYRDRLGGFTWALHIAGLETREKLDQEIIEDKLRRAVHRKNKHRYGLIETLSASEIKESDMLPEELRDKPFFESTEDAYEKAELGIVRNIENEAKICNNVTAHFPEIEEIDESDNRAVFYIELQRPV